MRRIATMVVLATAMTVCMLVPGTASASSAQTQCASDVSSYVVTARWCNVVSTAYPKTTGWYGYVGLGGGPCNSFPRGTEFLVGGSIGICSAPAPISVWKYSSRGWIESKLADGTRGYVAPYDSTWRWLYVKDSWYAIRASQLTLEWRVI